MKLLQVNMLFKIKLILHFYLLFISGLQKKKKKSFMAILRYGKGGKNETLASEYAFQNKTNFALLPLVYLWTPK